MKKIEVYHLTSPDITLKIVVEGLKPQLYLNQKPEVKAVEDIFEDFAPKGFTRRFAAFAFPERHIAMWHTWILGEGAVIATVDSQAALVTDLELYSDAVYALRDRDIRRTRKLAKWYWTEAVTLEEYFSLPKSRRTKYNSWEVIIPGGVEPYDLRIELLPRTKFR